MWGHHGYRQSGEGASSHINKLIKTNRLSKNVLILSMRGGFCAFFLYLLGLTEVRSVTGVHSDFRDFSTVLCKWGRRLFNIDKNATRRVRPLS